MLLKFIAYLSVIYHINKPVVFAQPGQRPSFVFGFSGSRWLLHTHLFFSERSPSLGWMGRKLLRLFAWMVVLWPALLWGQPTPKLSALQNMNFGNVNAVTGGGPVVMHFNGGLTPTGVTLAGGTPTNMQVTFNGQNPNPYIWNNVPASASLGGGITVDTWTSNPVGFQVGGIFPTGGFIRWTSEPRSASRPRPQQASTRRPSPT